jgi:hypothetical protein
VTPFLFSTCHALSLAEAVTGGEPRIVRSQRPRCRFLLAFTRFSRPRYRFERATSASCPDGVAVAIDVHGSEDQEKDASTAEHERHVSVFLESGACASKSACGRRSLPRRPLDIRCRRCVAERGGDPFLDGGPNQDLRSDADPRRPTPSRRPGCLPPLRSAVSVRTRIAPNPNLPRRSLAHAAHTLSPGWGECLHGHCKHQGAVTRDPWHSRNKRLCYRWVRSFRICRAWD